MGSTEQQRLMQHWANRGDVKRAAEMMGMDRSYVSAVKNGLRPITPEFRWAFYCAYGAEVTAQIFDDAPQVQKVTVTYYATGTGTQPAEVRA